MPSSRAERWRLCDRVLALPARPLLMGIVNVTPDSFSDGGRYFDTESAVAHGLELVRQGADLLDIGGESTRPYAEAVTADEELRRVLPVVQKLSVQTRVPLSIDTSKPAVAREALAAGAEIINDVTGLADPDMVDIAVQSGAALCAMHMLGTPRTMQNDPVYANVVDDVFDFLRRRRDSFLEAGIEKDRIALDPGIGFGKTTKHNLDLLRSIDRFHQLGCPILVGHSRKRFIGELLGDAEIDRTAGTVGGALALARRDVQILRVHDVAAVRQALQLFEAAGGLDNL